MSNYIMALDQGTTSSRCILFDRHGNVCSEVLREFTQIFPRDGWVEHDATEIWETQMSVAYEAMLRQPRVFGKCLVVAGSAHGNKIQQAKGNFYIVHGEYDRTIPLDRALQTEQALRSNPRNNVKLCILPQMQHIDSCLSGYDTAAWKWAFSPTNRKKRREEK